MLQLLDDPPELLSSDCAEMARSIFDNNARAIDESYAAADASRRLSPPPIDVLDDPDIEWLYGRDGSLTARVGEQWLSGCSVPMLAGQEMARTVSASGAVLCLLDPPHGHMLKATMDRLTALQSVVVIKPCPKDFALFLATRDFSDLIRAHRLYFVGGAFWGTMLTALLDALPGLPLPSQFVRLSATSDRSVQHLIETARPIIAAAQSARARLSHECCRSPRPLHKRVAVVTQSHFRLWEDAGSVAAMTLGQSAQFSTHLLDQDHPHSGCPTALARLAATSDALVTANFGRGDLPGIVSNDRAWITWITHPRIPAYDASCPRDALVLADQSWQRDALSVGWPASRVRVGAWPSSTLPLTPARQPCLSLICDVVSLDIPDDKLPYSSHAVLWEHLARDLVDNPFALLAGPGPYLTARMADLQIAENGFDRRLFFERLLWPGYAQGIARCVIRAGLPIRLYGRGWSDLNEFAQHASEPVASRQHLERIAHQHAAIVHCWPGTCAHPADALGTPTVRARSTAELIGLGRKAIDGKLPIPASTTPTFSSELIASLLAD